MKITLTYEFETTEEYIKHIQNMNLDKKENNENNEAKKYYCNNKECKKEITKAEVSYCLSRDDKFNGRVYCKECQQKI